MTITLFNERGDHLVPTVPTTTLLNEKSDHLVPTVPHEQGGVTTSLIKEVTIWCPLSHLRKEGPPHP